MGFLKLKRGDFWVAGSPHIKSVVREAINKSMEDVGGGEGPLITFDFNHVRVSVKDDSDPELIIRNCLRALSDCIIPDVGPYPDAPLTPEEEENDRLIRAVRNRLLDIDFPDLKVLYGRDEWSRFYSSRLDDPFDAACLKYAVRWGRLMQHDMSQAAIMLPVSGQMHLIAVSAAREAGFPTVERDLASMIWDASTQVLLDHWKYCVALSECVYNEEFWETERERILDRVFSASQEA